jgi:hypothetical protein
LATVYSQRLVQAHDVSSGDFSVPAGFLWVVRDISIFCPGVETGGSVQFFDNDTLATWFWAPVTPDLAGVYVEDPDCRKVLPSESSHHFQTSLPSNVDITLNGYALTLP